MEKTEMSSERTRVGVDVRRGVRLVKVREVKKEQELLQRGN